MLVFTVFLLDIQLIFTGVEQCRCQEFSKGDWRSWD